MPSARDPPEIRDGARRHAPVDEGSFQHRDHFERPRTLSLSEQERELRAGIGTSFENRFSNQRNGPSFESVAVLRVALLAGRVDHLQLGAQFRRVLFAIEEKLLERLGEAIPLLHERDEVG